MKTFEDFSKFYNKLPLAKKFDLHRKHGLFDVDPTVESRLFANKAKQLKMSAENRAAILYALENQTVLSGLSNGASCGCNSGSCATDLAGVKKFDLPKQNFDNYSSEIDKLIDKFTKPNSKELQSECYAFYLPITEIYTDPQRFQNRTDAFSELSAAQVALEYNKNYFDPIVVWFDERAGKTYCLSGHSRLEGMKRRGEKLIPARKFEGTEEEAITYSRVIANRAANKENLLEDLRAYKLMRDGDEALGIKPTGKKDLQTAFKGKHTKLEALTYLNPNGLFLQELNKEKELLPYLETRARWVGDLRKELPNLTNNHEDEIFFFFYAGDRKGLKMEQEAFKQTVRTRLAILPQGGALFPECQVDGCTEVKECRDNLSKQACEDVQNLVAKDQAISNRFKTDDVVYRIYTPQEEQALLAQRKKLQDEIAKMQKGLEFLEQQSKLFGLK